MTKPTNGAGEAPADLTFEEAMAALDEAVTRLEAGDLTIDEALALYERGVALTERCAQVLTAAELRLQQVDAEGRDAGEVTL